MEIARSRSWASAIGQFEVALETIYVLSRIAELHYGASFSRATSK